MKTKKILIGVCMVLVMSIGGIIWWDMPITIIDIEPSEVSKISVFDGNTGKSITITDETDIKHIINNLNKVSLQKEKISLGYAGYSYRTTIYKVNGSVYKEFIINSNDTIRKDPFFYRDPEGQIDYMVIQKLFEKDKGK